MLLAMKNITQIHTKMLKKFDRLPWQQQTEVDQMAYRSWNENHPAQEDNM